MPNGLLSFFALAGFIVAGYFGFVLQKVIPDFIDVANKTPISDWGWKGCMVLIILGFLAFIVWLFGSVSLRCNGLLKDRLFK